MNLLLDWSISISLDGKTLNIFQPIQILLYGQGAYVADKDTRNDSKGFIYTFVL